MQWERSQCCSSFRGGDAKTVQSCSTEELRRQGIVMKAHCSRSDLQRANRRRKRKMVLELLLPKPGGMCYRRILVKVGRWAVMKMGLENITHDVLLNWPRASIWVRTCFRIGLVPQFGLGRA